MTTALEGSEGAASRPGRFLRQGKDPEPILQEAGWATGPVWTGVENLVYHWNSIPRPSSSVASRYTDYATRHIK